MHDRALDYARCTQALREDRERPGFAGIFDEALTNALAAIVAARWPGTEMRGSRVKSASELLDVIEEHGDGESRDAFVSGSLSGGAIGEAFQDRSVLGRTPACGAGTPACATKSTRLY